MGSWRDTILNDFETDIARLTLVSDPDGLLTEEGMLTEIQRRGFDLIPFEDSIAFRYAYESKYRSAWDAGEKTDLVVVLRSEHDIDALPYDLLNAGRQLKYGLHGLFPKLNYKVVSSLDRSCLDAVYEAYKQQDDSTLGENGTKEFVLTHCFGIVHQLVKTPVALLKVLLSRHYRNILLPEILDGFLLGSLKRAKHFTDWPLEEIWESRNEFLRFMQSQWEEFLLSLRDSGHNSLVPFDHQDVRAYVDTYFWEGLLTPVSVEQKDDLPEWVHVGVVHDQTADRLSRFRHLAELCEQDLPGDDASHKDWQKTAGQWAELVVLRWELRDAIEAEDASSFSTLHETIERRFADWMKERFSTLHNIPFMPHPVIVHHVPKFLASMRREHEWDRLAMLIIDGLSLDQWIVLRNIFESVEPSWQYEESTVFAWVPTLTSISRQSMFAGEIPLFFPKSLETTSKEKTHWRRFWENHDLTKGEIEYVKMVESGDSEDLARCLDNPHLSVLGIVVNKLDKLVHNQLLGTAGMHNDLELWAEKARSVIARLLDAGCAIYLTADHGNVAATGMGIPRQGVLVETTGKRARIYDNKTFLVEAQEQFPESFVWPSVGLPPDRHVLLPAGLKAFANEGTEVVSHGGLALEEVIVPFVKVSRDQE